MAAPFALCGVRFGRRARPTRCGTLPGFSQSARPFHASVAGNALDACGAGRIFRSCRMRAGVATHRRARSNDTPPSCDATTEPHVRDPGARGSAPNQPPAGSRRPIPSWRPERGRTSWPSSPSPATMPPTPTHTRAPAQIRPDGRGIGGRDPASVGTWWTGPGDDKTPGLARLLDRNVNPSVSLGNI